MSDLSRRDLEMVALGAAMGSNCSPCVEYHIPEARKAGVSDSDILAAIRHADMIRQVPARKTLQTALKMLPSQTGATANAQEREEGGSGAATGDDTNGAGKGVSMRGMMSKMMAACGGSERSAEVAKSTGKTAASDAPASDGCGCG